MRDKEKLKTKILEILEDNKPEIIPIDEIKNALHVEKAEDMAFQRAIMELEKERRIKSYMSIP